MHITCKLYIVFCFFTTPHIVKINNADTIYLLLFIKIVAIILVTLYLKGKAMENSVNNIPDNLNAEQIAHTPATSQATENTTQQATEQITEAQSGGNPVYIPPVYENQFPPQTPPGTYTAPCYTPPATPYNQGYVQVQSQPYQSPSSIYNNAQQGTAPQYHYGAPMVNPGFNNAYYEEQKAKFLHRKKEEKKLRSIGNISGAILIACMFVALFFRIILSIPSVYDFYESSVSGSSFINMIYTLVVVGGTFVVFGKFLKQHAKNQAIEAGGVDAYEFKTKLSAPKNPLKTTLLIIISFGGCMLANYISSILLTILQGFGLYSTYSSIENPKSTVDLILMCISTAVIPALVEELALRGILLSSLRRYGNAFAIVASAFMFGIFHGDAAQIPFAFICGLFFAYAVIATESLWTGIIIHAMNNSLSCISSVLMQVADEETANMFFYVVSIGGIILGFICLFLYVALYKGNILKQTANPYDVASRSFAQIATAPITLEDDSVLMYKGDANVLTTSQKLGKFITSPVMIVAILMYIGQALTTLTNKG